MFSRESYDYDEDRRMDALMDAGDGRDHISGFCSHCGEECTSITRDEGVGAYEYWGSKGVHHDYVEVSPCCDAEVQSEPLEGRCCECNAPLEGTAAFEEGICAHCAGDASDQMNVH